MEGNEDNAEMVHREFSLQYFLKYTVKIINLVAD